MIPIPPPVLAAAASDVKKLISNLASSIIGLVDPGKKRDAQREQKAETYYQVAKLGSLTAARHLYGGSYLQYTIKEKGFYSDRWTRFKTESPTLAQQAVTAGGINSTPDITDADISQMQKEVDAVAAEKGTTAPPASSRPALSTAAAAPASRAMLWLVAGGAVLVVAVAVVAGRRR